MSNLKIPNKFVNKLIEDSFKKPSETSNSYTGRRYEKSLEDDNTYNEINRQKIHSDTQFNHTINQKFQKKNDLPGNINSSLKERELIFDNTPDKENKNDYSYSRPKFQDRSAVTVLNELIDNYDDRMEFDCSIMKPKKLCTKYDDNISINNNSSHSNINIDKVEMDSSPSKIRNTKEQKQTDFERNLIKKLMEGIQIKNDGTFVINTNKMINCKTSVNFNEENKRNQRIQLEKTSADEYNLHTQDKFMKIPRPTDALSKFSKNFAGSRSHASLPTKTFNTNKTSKDFSVYDQQRLTYDILKHYSNLKVSPDSKFLDRMEFYAIKKQSKERKIKEMIDSSKPKINERQKLQAFNRLIDDSNRRSDVKIRVQEWNQKLGRDSKHEELLKIIPELNQGQKMTKSKWEKIYNERFQQKVSVQKEKLEKERKHKEESKKVKEETMIKEINSRTVRKSPEVVRAISNRLYNEAERRRMKAEAISSKKLIRSTSFSSKGKSSNQKLNYFSDDDSLNGLIKLTRSTKYSGVTSRYRNIKNRKLSSPKMNSPDNRSVVSRSSSKLKIPNMTKNQFNVNRSGYISPKYNSPSHASGLSEGFSFINESNKGTDPNLKMNDLKSRKVKQSSNKKIKTYIPEYLANHYVNKLFS